MKKYSDYTVEELENARATLLEAAEDDDGYFMVDKVVYALASHLVKQELTYTGEAPSLEKCMTIAKEMSE